MRLQLQTLQTTSRSPRAFHKKEMERWDVRTEPVHAERNKQTQKGKQKNNGIAKNLSQKGYKKQQVEFTDLVVLFVVEKKINACYGAARWVYERLRCEPWRPWGGNHKKNLVHHNKAAPHVPLVGP